MNLYQPTISGSLTVSGSVIVDGTIIMTSGSISGTASLAQNSLLLNNLNSGSFTGTGSFSNVSSSFAATSGSLSTRVTNLEATSSVLTATSASFATTSGSLSSRVTIIEGQDATTGSNTFTGVQYISQASNAISFTSTASLYTDGGLRVAKDSFVSGTAYFNNITVYGTSSIQYITSSQVNIGSNIITVNTDTPAVRFGGLSVFDSGSTQLTGSIFWDSEKNHWIYSNPSGSSYNSAMLMNGPRNTGSLGNEQGTTNNALMKGQGGDHITSSQMIDDGTTVRIPGALQVTGSTVITGALTGSSASFSSAVTSVGNYLINNNAATKKGYTFNSPASDWGPQTSGLYFNPVDGVSATPTFTINLWNGSSGTVGYGTFTDVLTINGAGGAATFSNSVTAGTHFKLSGRTTSFGYQFPDWQIYNTTGGGLAFNNYTSDFLTIASSGAATFSSSVTANQFISNATDVGGEYYFFRGNTNLSNNFTVYAYSNFVYLNAYNSINIRANSTGGSGGTINLTGGNVGIGYGSPNATLAVRADNGTSTSALVRLRDTNSTARTTRIQFEDYNGTIADGLIDFVVPTAGSGTGARLSLGVNSGTLHLINGGNVLIGTTTDTGQRLVSSGGNVRLSSAYTSFQTSTKTAGSGVNITFDLNGDYSQGTNGDNVGGLVIINISEASSNVALGNAAYVGLVINPRGGSGTITQISKSLGGGVTVFNVSMSGNNIVANASLSSGATYRATMTFVGGAGTS
jgi:hypothetical protein